MQPTKQRCELFGGPLDGLKVDISPQATLYCAPRKNGQGKWLRIYYRYSEFRKRWEHVSDAGTPTPPLEPFE